MARRVALAGHTFLPSRKEGRKGPGRKWTEERRGGEGIRSSWITHIQIMVMTDRFPPSFLWSIRRGGPFVQLPTCNDRYIILIRRGKRELTFVKRISATRVPFLRGGGERFRREAKDQFQSFLSEVRFVFFEFNSINYKSYMIYN